jgi:hypothetical protein
MVNGKQETGGKRIGYCSVFTNKSKIRLHGLLESAIELPAKKRIGSFLKKDYLCNPKIFE